MIGKCPRLLLNKVVRKGTIMLYYAPVIVYVYSYVLYDCICNKNVNSSDS